MHEKNARTLALLIRLCDDLAWGRPADEDALFALTLAPATQQCLLADRKSVV